ncbi:MAG: hypothetical protein WA741_34410, partial [Candidatus Sulfotelmatobacter sp.]
TAAAFKFVNETASYLCRGAGLKMLCVSQQPLASPAHFSDRGPAERSFSFLSRIAGRYRGWIAAHWMSL